MPTGSPGVPFPQQPEARWRRAARPDEKREIAALDVAISHMKQQIATLKRRKHRIMNRAAGRLRYAETVKG